MSGLFASLKFTKEQLLKIRPPAREVSLSEIAYAAGGYFFEEKVAKNLFTALRPVAVQFVLFVGLRGRSVNFRVFLTKSSVRPTKSPYVSKLPTVILLLKLRKSLFDGFSKIYFVCGQPFRLQYGYCVAKKYLKHRRGDSQNSLP